MVLRHPRRGRHCRRFSHLALALLAVAVLAAQTGRAAAVCFTDIAAGLPGVADGAVAWGDYDNDGDLDILLTGRPGGGVISRVYRNSGGPTPTFTDILTGLPGVAQGAVAWADFNNDGYLDILLTGSSTGSAISKIYKNNGGPNPLFTDLLAPLPGVGASAVAVGDYDNDGDLDFVLTGSTGSSLISRIYRNNGGANPTFTDITAGLPGVSTGVVSWADYDNDGDLDLMLAGFTNSGYIARIYRNSGGATPTFTEALNACCANNGSVAWGDYDNDGDLDFVGTGGSGPSAGAYVYRNFAEFDPVDPFFDFQDVGLSGAQRGTVAWGDYNNDGWLDVLVAGYDGLASSAKVFESSGGESPTFTDIGAGLPGVGRASPTLVGSAAAWGDYDNDGRLDILLTGQMSDFTYIARIYRNTCGSPNTPPSAPTNLQVSLCGRRVTFSWTGATDAETPSLGLSYDLRVGTAPGLADIVKPMASLATGYRRVVALGNAIQKRDVELPGAGPYYWSVQAVDGAFAGSPFATESSVAASLAGLAPHALATGDFDNDGILDLVVCSGTTPTATVLHGGGSGGVGDGTFSAVQTLSLGATPMEAATADFDADGRQDIAISQSGTTGSVSVFLNNGGTFGPPSNIQLVGHADGLAIADMDQDGILDLAVCLLDSAATNHGGIEVYRGGGQGGMWDHTFVAGLKSPNGSPGSAKHAVIHDFNQDGTPDLVYTSELLNSGQPGRTFHVLEFEPGLQLACNKGTTMSGLGIWPSDGSLSTGDFNGDGKADVALVLGRAVWVLLKNGLTSTQCASWFGFSTFLQAPSTPREIAAVDFNQDGILDIAATFDSLGAVQLYPGHGTAGVGDGTFDPPITLASGDVWGLAVGDFVTNGSPDLAISQPTCGSVSVIEQPSAPTLPTNLTLVSPNGGEVWPQSNVTQTASARRIEPTAATSFQTQDGRFRLDSSAVGALESLPRIANVQHITWSKGAGVQGVDVAIPRNDGLSWQTISTNTPGTDLVWIVTPPGSPHTRVRVSDTAVPGREDASDAAFDIPSGPTGVEQGIQAPRLAAFSLPDRSPARDVVHFRMDLPASAEVEVQVYDVAGRIVRSLVRGRVDAGSHSVAWDTRDARGSAASQGVYFVRARWGSFQATRKVIVVR